MRIRFALATLVTAVSAGLALTAQSQLKDARPTQLATYRDVTEALLRNPPPEDWLNWRRTDNNWGYSTLNQITTQNVQQLQLAWSWHMDDSGANEATPLVHDGIMYLPNPRGVIQALDAATGDLIWEYRPDLEAAPAPRAANAGGGEQTDVPRQTQRPAAAASGGDNERGIQRNIAIFGDRDLRHNQRCAYRGHQRQDRETRLGHEDGGQLIGLSVHRWPDRRARQGDCRHYRLQPIQERCLLHRRIGRDHRKRALAHVEHRQAR